MSFNMEEDKDILGIFVVTIVMLIAMWSGGRTGQIVASYSIIAFFGLYILRGTKSSANRTKSKPFIIVIIGLVIILGAAFASIWYFHFLDPSYSDPTYWFGFPRATAMVIFFLWMPPALWVEFTYPYIFDNYIWSEDQIKRFREGQVNQTGKESKENDSKIEEGGEE